MTEAGPVTMKGFMESAPRWLNDAFGWCIKRKAVDWGHSSEEDFSMDSEGVVTDILAEAELISSKGVTVGTSAAAYHLPMFDIDKNCALIPSSTNGNFHLVIEHEIPFDKYMAILHAFAEAGIVEWGYHDGTRKRGYAAIRAPWVRKGDERADAQRAFNEWLVDHPDQRPPELQGPGVLDEWLLSDSPLSATPTTAPW